MKEVWDAIRPVNRSIIAKYQQEFYTGAQPNASKFPESRWKLKYIWVTQHPRTAEHKLALNNCACLFGRLFVH